MTAERDPKVLRRTAAWHDDEAAKCRPLDWKLWRHERIARELREEADRLEAQDRKDTA